MTDRRTSLTPKHVEELTILSENVDKVDNIINHYQLQNKTLNLGPEDYEAWVKIAVNEVEDDQPEDDTAEDSDTEEEEQEDDTDDDEMPALVPRI